MSSPVNPGESPIESIQSLRPKPETRVSPRPDAGRSDADFEPRYIEVPRRRRAQLAAERNLKWGLAVLLLALGLVGAAIIVSGPRALVPLVLCLVTFTILWAMARLRVFHQRNGVFFSAAMVCLLGAAVPLVERGYVELDRMAHANPPAVAPVIAAAPAPAPVEPEPVLQKLPESVPSVSDPEPEPASLVDAFKVPIPTDPKATLVRVVETTKITVGRKPYLLHAGDTFLFEATKNGQVTFRANELHLSLPEQAVELMAGEPPAVGGVVRETPAPVNPPRSAGPHVSDQELPGDATDRAQAVAVRRYPGIGEKGSPENQLFVARFRQLKDERPEFFDDAEWPLFLAEVLAKEQGWEPVK